MIQITLTPEQEQFLEKQLNTGKYSTPQEVISKAFQLLEEQECEIVLPSYIKGTESAKQLLKEKIRKYREEREKNKDKSIDPERARLSRELSDLFDKTQAIRGIQDITEEEIATEIEAYRRGDEGYC
jgi:putative addiction module CopG family antidote